MLFLIQQVDISVGKFVARLYLRSLCPHSLLEEEDYGRDPVVEPAEQIFELVGVPGVLGDVSVLFHPLLQVLKLKHDSRFSLNVQNVSSHVMIL